MKSIMLVALVLVSSLAFAQTQPPATGSSPTKQVAPPPAEFDTQMAQVQENMKKMQEQLNKLQQTQNPQER